MAINSAGMCQASRWQIVKRTSIVCVEKISLEQAHNLFDHAFPDAFLAMFSAPSSALFHLTEAHELPRQAKRSIYRLIKPEPRRDHHHR